MRAMKSGLIIDLLYVSTINNFYFRRNANDIFLLHFAAIKFAFHPLSIDR